MEPSIPIVVAAALFLALALANVVLMLELSSPSHDARGKNRLILLHRATGYLFVALFCVMAYTMSQRLAGTGITKNLPTYLVLHIVLALSLVPLLLLKLVIARFYKQSYSILRALGIAIFIVSWLVVSLPTFSEVLRSARPGTLGMRIATGFLVSACLVQCFVLLRSAKHSGQAAQPAGAPANAEALDHSPNRPVSLLLEQVQQQTPDTKTLRFVLQKEKRLCFKPGQFLTFRWTINGRQVPRSYTISSSPTQPNYIEITPKRMPNGCVSVFLNDEAKPGLAVDATGPYGNFCFAESIDRNVVFLAAGSGITPMMSMLRYMKDRQISVSVILLYFVRAHNDIIFASELDLLVKVLPNFKYRVCLSRPDQHWTGDSGHLTQELLLRHVPDPGERTYFLCGPKGFMETARGILSAVGIGNGQIAQESFGEKNIHLEAPSAHRAATIVFSTSQKVCDDGDGRTLLEVAEKNGVKIPYGCRQGVCGTCVTRLLSGNVRMENEAGLSPEHRQAGFVLPCVSHAEGTAVLVA